jgi:hypothetical protein
MASSVAIAIRETEAREAQAQAMRDIAATLQQIQATQAETLIALAAIEAAMTAPEPAKKAATK